MAFNPMQFRDLIERVLMGFDPMLATPDAIALLMGTAAQESKLGTFLQQIGGGPGLGVFQMEPTTFEWLQKKYKSKYPEIADWYVGALEFDLRKAIIMARLRYRIVPAPLAAANDLAGMAAYWNKWYNANPDKGTDAEFIANFKRYVA